MSRPREVRAAQREAPKRHPEMFDQLMNALDEQGEDEDINFGDWKLPEPQQKEQES